MSKSKEEKFWLDDPTELLSSLNIIPTCNLPTAAQLNALTRLTLVTSGALLLLQYDRWYWVLVGGIVVIIAIYIIKRDCNSNNNNSNPNNSDNPATLKGPHTPHESVPAWHINNEGAPIGSLVTTGGLVEPELNVNDGIYRQLGEPYCPYGADSCQFYQRAQQLGELPSGCPDQEYIQASPYSTGCPPAQEGRPDLYKQQYTYPLTSIGYTEYQQPANFKTASEYAMRGLTDCKLQADTRYHQDQSQFRNDMIRLRKEKMNNAVRKLPLAMVPEF
jgi:hypothetical protein